MANKEFEKLLENKHKNDETVLRDIAEKYVAHHDRVRELVYKADMPDFISKTMVNALNEAESLRTETTAHYVLGLDLFKQKMEFKVYCDQYTNILMKLSRADGILYQALDAYAVWLSHNQPHTEVEDEHCNG